MRSNQYLYISDLNSNYKVIFNGITKDFIPMPNDHSDQLANFLKQPDIYKQSHPALISELKKRNFIVDDAYDELEALRISRSDFINS